MTRAKKIFLFCFLLLLILPLASAQAQSGTRCDPNSAPDTNLCNPFGTQYNFFGAQLSGVGDFKFLLLRLLYIFTTFTGLIPIMIVIAAGFQMMISRGNAEAVTRAKAALSWAVYGFIVAILSFVLVAGMTTFLGATKIPDPSNPTGPSIIVNPLEDKTFGEFLIKRLVGSFLEIAGLLAILMLIFNGFRYITAGGDEEQITEAKNALKWIVSGIVAILFAYVIISAAASLVGLRP